MLCSMKLNLIRTLCKTLNDVTHKKINFNNTTAYYVPSENYLKHISNIASFKQRSGGSILVKEIFCIDFESKKSETRS